MGKLHELLAVEASVSGNYNRDLDETLKVMGRGDLFRRDTAKKEYFDAAEAEKLNTVETKEITTTVQDRLNWFSKAATNLYDVIAQKDATNQTATADVIIDGVTVLTGLPATTLLTLETKLADLRKVYESTPTLPAGIAWQRNDQQNLWEAKEGVVTFVTKKTAKPVVLYEATKEHPAQVKEVFEDVPVAKITKTQMVGMLTSAEKATILGRLDSLLQAIKTARQRANTAPVVNVAIGNTIFAYLHKDVIKS
jgi:hypothetical protein